MAGESSRYRNHRGSRFGHPRDVGELVVCPADGDVLQWRHPAWRRLPQRPERIWQWIAAGLL